MSSTIQYDLLSHFSCAEFNFKQQVCVLMLHNLFLPICKFVNNLYYVLKDFVDTQILYSCINKIKVNSLSYGKGTLNYRNMISDCGFYLSA